MRIQYFAASLLVAAAVLPANAETLDVAPGRYAIDSSSQIHFSVGQIGGGGIEGTFQRFHGVFDLHPKDIGKSTVDFVLNPGSVTAGTPVIENFLKSGVVFDVADYPDITFRSTRVTQTGDTTAKIEGTLTAKGHTYPQTFDATLVSAKGSTLAFHVVGQIRRGYYDMEIGAPIYSTVVDLDMVMNGRRQ
ncbi:hypothetical protein HDIA_1452 [Hartmannibacter diazotrophicus]|uniref:Lipid/polyisoprenoid-binding YceI-like domain-containing protein n=1 Tax=Hartmannibacter diazotrophicus TaxID=1482074 RepID=A0A2C9D432_9HYPH|nr:YceI family protein [Hartmannibacter diazotrophicus]SON54993.1 hypothetical protein HDIA_1452 [Hartmannibacter diazotrophicus]